VISKKGGCRPVELFCWPQGLARRGAKVAAVCPRDLQVGKPLVPTPGVFGLIVCPRLPVSDKTLAGRIIDGVGTKE
jgi:hypothetical protein